MLFLRWRYTLRIRAQANLHPRTYRWQQQRPGCDYLPDAVDDTTFKRKRGAARLFGNGEGLLSRLVAYKSRKVYHLVIPLGRLSLYWEAPKVARQQLKDLLGQVSYIARLALSRQKVAHLHVLAALQSAEAQALARRSIYCEAVKDAEHLQALARYFSRPKDERAARPKPADFARYSVTELQQQALDAAEDCLAAIEERKQRGLKQLPRLSWYKNIPKLKADHPTWLEWFRVLKANKKADRKVSQPLQVGCSLVDTLVAPYQKSPAMPRPGLPNARAPPGL